MSRRGHHTCDTWERQWRELRRLRYSHWWHLLRDSSYQNVTHLLEVSVMTSERRRALSPFFLGHEDSMNAYHPLSISETVSKAVRQTNS